MTEVAEDWPDWKKQARISADVLKEHAENASDYAEEMAYELDGMTDCPELLDLDNLEVAVPERLGPW